MTLCKCSDMSRLMPLRAFHMCRCSNNYLVSTSYFGPNLLPANIRHFRPIEPAHEIMALFILCKLILQTRMCSHPMGLDVWFFGRTLCLIPYFMCANSEGSGGTARACLILRWSPMWLSTIISRAGSTDGGGQKQFLKEKRYHLNIQQQQSDQSEEQVSSVFEDSWRIIFVSSP